LAQDGGQYDAEVKEAVGYASKFFSLFPPPNASQLVVFDIDETALMNLKVTWNWWTVRRIDKQPLSQATTLPVSIAHLGIDACNEGPMHGR
jgi:hypothetical protein